MNKNDFAFLATSPALRAVADTRDVYIRTPGGMLVVPSYALADRGTRWVSPGHLAHRSLEELVSDCNTAQEDSIERSWDDDDSFWESEGVRFAGYSVSGEAMGQGGDFDTTAVMRGLLGNPHHGHVYVSTPAYVTSLSSKSRFLVYTFTEAAEGSTHTGNGTILPASGVRRLPSSVQVVDVAYGDSFMLKATQVVQRVTGCIHVVGGGVAGSPNSPVTKPYNQTTVIATELVVAHLLRTASVTERAKDAAECATIARGELIEPSDLRDILAMNDAEAGFSLLRYVPIRARRAMEEVLTTEDIASIARRARAYAGSGATFYASTVVSIATEVMAGKLRSPQPVAGGSSLNQSLIPYAPNF